VARISGGSVSITIEDTTLPSLDLLNPVVLLHKITRDTGAWTESVDIRRFGLFVNDKNFISVGRTPPSGNDGYGCDFLSLKGAVEYAKALATLDKLITPRKIVLVNDIVATTDADIGIMFDSDLEGFEIDGCGKTLILDGGFTLPIFQINTSQIKIHDLTVLSAASAAPTCFAHVGVTTYANDVQIVRCGIKTQPGFDPVDTFLLLGEVTGVVTISDMLVANNTVSVANGGIVYAYTATSFTPILLASKIIGNHIYQDTPAVATLPAIQASVECVVSDNIILGGFTIGVSIHAPVDSVVSNNLITGTDFSNIYMATGIASWVPGPNGNAFGVMITDNIIKGVSACGVNIAMPGGRAGRQTIISGNLIDNSNIGTWPFGVYGISVNRFEVPVVGNKIVWMGYPIDRAGFVIGNEIYGHGVATGNGILCVSYAPTATVCNNRLYNLNTGASTAVINVNGSDLATVSGNVIYDCTSDSMIAMGIIGSGSKATVLGNMISECTGIGINMARCPQATIVGNLLFHTTGAGGAGIDEIGDDTVVSNNVVIKYANAFAGAAVGSDRLSFVSNRALGCSGNGIDIDNSHMSLVVGNALIADGANASNGIRGFASNSVVCGNIISGYGYGGSRCIYAPCDYGPLRSAIVVGNLIDTPHGNMSAAIAMTGSAPDRWLDIVIANNVVYTTKTGSCHHGIDVSGSAKSIISGNLLFDSSGDAHSGIYNVGPYSVVANNGVFGYGSESFGGDKYGISLIDAYASVVIGNTIAAGVNMTTGICLDGIGLDNLIANNVLHSLVYTGIDLGVLRLSARNIVSGNIIIGTSASNNAPGIANLCSQSVAIGNNISYANGDGILAVPGWVVLLGTWTGSAIIGNMVADPDAYGIHVNGVGGLIRLDYYSDLNSCLVSGNHVASADGYYGGIYLNDTWRASITGNFVKNFNVGIWLLGVSQGCLNNLISGNNIHQDPLQGIGTTGILIDAGCQSNHVTGNLIFGSLFGIDVNSNRCSVTSNHITWCRDVPFVMVGCGIEASGTHDCSIIGNYIGPGYVLSVAVDGINVFGCKRTLVVGNFAFGYIAGLSFRISPTATSGDVMVMAGNMGRLGLGSPNNGSGGTWPTGGVIDVECRFDASPIT
jgi:hypothetical protein